MTMIFDRPVTSEEMGIPGMDPVEDMPMTMTTPDSTLLIDARAAAQKLGLGARTLWSLTNRDALPSRRIGRLVRYDPVELAAWIEADCPTEPGAASRVRRAMRKRGGA